MFPGDKVAIAFKLFTELKTVNNKVSCDRTCKDDETESHTISFQ